MRLVSECTSWAGIIGHHLEDLILRLGEGVVNLVNNAIAHAVNRFEQRIRIV